jgi:transposase
MRRIREILRLCWELNLSHEDVGTAIGVSGSTVHRYVARAKAAGLSWPLPEVDDTVLENKLFPPLETRPAKCVEPDWNYIHSERKKKGVTTLLLWQEYKENNPDGYQLSQFFERYRQWRQLLNVTMRQTHRAGEKVFSDFAGTKFQVVDPSTGEVQLVSLFVSCLGASGYTFADVFWNETSASWCQGQARAFEYFGGTSEVIVPDNPKAVVTQPSRYEPELNISFAEMARHFGCAVIPARVRHPKDKAKVELSVALATRWILARLRNRTFFSLEELRQAIKPLLEDLNNRSFKKLPGSRKTAFEQLDKPALRPLPPAPYEYSEIHKVRVNFDHHIEFEQHWYSVPHQLVRKEVELRVTPGVVEVIHAGKRVASHPRNHKRGDSTTLDEHRPKAHQKYANQSKESIVRWAANFGPATTRVIEMAFERKAHPEEAYNRCFGILKFGKVYGRDRLEAACQRGLAAGAISYRSIKSILQTGLDQRPLPASQFPTQLIIAHSNIRGAEYFTTERKEQC